VAAQHRFNNVADPSEHESVARLKCMPAWRHGQVDPKSMCHLLLSVSEDKRLQMTQTSQSKLFTAMF